MQMIISAASKLTGRSQQPQTTQSNSGAKSPINGQQQHLKSNLPAGRTLTNNNVKGQYQNMGAISCNNVQISNQYSNINNNRNAQLKTSAENQHIRFNKSDNKGRFDYKGVDQLSGNTKSVNSQHPQQSSVNHKQALNSQNQIQNQQRHFTEGRVATNNYSNTNVNTARATHISSNSAYQRSASKRQSQTGRINNKLCQDDEAMAFYQPSTMEIQNNNSFNQSSSQSSLTSQISSSPTLASSIKNHANSNQMVVKVDNPFLKDTNYIYSIASSTTTPTVKKLTQNQHRDLYDALQLTIQTENSQRKQFNNKDKKAETLQFGSSKMGATDQQQNQQAFTSLSSYRQNQAMNNRLQQITPQAKRLTSPSSTININRGGGFLQSENQNPIGSFSIMASTIKNDKASHQFSAHSGRSMAQKNQYSSICRPFVSENAQKISIPLAKKVTEESDGELINSQDMSMSMLEDQSVLMTQINKTRDQQAKYPCDLSQIAAVDNTNKIMMKNDSEKSLISCIQPASATITQKFNQEDIFKIKEGSFAAQQTLSSNNGSKQNKNNRQKGGVTDQVSIHNQNNVASPVEINRQSSSKKPLEMLSQSKIQQLQQQYDDIKKELQKLKANQQKPSTTNQNSTLSPVPNSNQCIKETKYDHINDKSAALLSEKSKSGLRQKRNIDIDDDDCSSCYSDTLNIQTSQLLKLRPQQDTVQEKNTRKKKSFYQIRSVDAQFDNKGLCSFDNENQNKENTKLNKVIQANKTTLNSVRKGILNQQTERKEKAKPQIVKSQISLGLKRLSLNAKAAEEEKQQRERSVGGTKSRKSRKRVASSNSFNHSDQSSSQKYQDCLSHEHSLDKSLTTEYQEAQGDQNQSICSCCQNQDNDKKSYRKNKLENNRTGNKSTRTQKSNNLKEQYCEPSIINKSRQSKKSTKRKEPKRSTLDPKNSKKNSSSMVAPPQNPWLIQHHAQATLSLHPPPQQLINQHPYGIHQQIMNPYAQQQQYVQHQQMMYPQMHQNPILVPHIAPVTQTLPFQQYQQCIPQQVVANNMAHQLNFQQNIGTTSYQQNISAISNNQSNIYQKSIIKDIMASPYQKYSPAPKGTSVVNDQDNEAFEEFMKFAKNKFNQTENQNNVTQFQSLLKQFQNTKSSASRNDLYLNQYSSKTSQDVQILNRHDNLLNQIPVSATNQKFTSNEKLNTSPGLQSQANQYSQHKFMDQRRLSHQEQKIEVSAFQPHKFIEPSTTRASEAGGIKNNHMFNQSLSSIGNPGGFGQSELISTTNKASLENGKQNCFSDFDHNGSQLSQMTTQKSHLASKTDKYNQSQDKDDVSNNDLLWIGFDESRQANSSKFKKQNLETGASQKIKKLQKEKQQFQRQVIKEEQEEEYVSPDKNKRTIEQLDRLQQSLQKSGYTNIVENKSSTQKVQQKPKAWAMEFGLELQSTEQKSDRVNQQNLADAFRKKMHGLEDKLQKRQTETKMASTSQQQNKSFSKEELAEKRKNLLKSARQNAANLSNQQQITQKCDDDATGKTKGLDTDKVNISSQTNDLMARLANGQKKEISKKEMLRLTSRNYENLPEIKQKKLEEAKKEEQKKRLESAKDQVKRMREQQLQKRQTLQIKQQQQIKEKAQS